MNELEAVAWLDERAALIYVREKRDNRWQSLALAELEPVRRAYHTGRLVERLMSGGQVVTLREPEPTS